MKAYFSIIIFLLVVTNGFSQTKRSVNDAKGLTVGVKAPDFSAIDSDSVSFSLANALKNTPVVLVFYRGFWCPVCNKHLAQIQDSLQFITNKGVSVIAVSPEKPEFLEKMADKSGATFKLLYDEGYKIADSYDVTFTPKTTEAFVYNTVLGANLKETHSDDSHRLPIPATYLIDKNGVIVWRQFNPDYKKRSSVSEILKAIDEIKLASNMFH